MTMTNRYLLFLLCGIIDKMHKTHADAHTHAYTSEQHSFTQRQGRLTHARTLITYTKEQVKWQRNGAHLLLELARISELRDFLYDFGIVKTFGKTVRDDTGHLFADCRRCDFAPILEQLFNIISVEKEKERGAVERERQHQTHKSFRLNCTSTKLIALISRGHKNTQSICIIAIAATTTTMKWPQINVALRLVGDE